MFPLTARQLGFIDDGNTEPRERSERNPRFWSSSLPVIVLSMLFDVYRYWLLGSSTMHTGPEPIAYGLLVPSESVCNWPSELIVNAEIELEAVDVVEGVMLLITYRNLPFALVSELIGVAFVCGFVSWLPETCASVQGVPPAW